MNYGPLLFLGAFLALAGSWFGFVLSPQLQVGQFQVTNTVPAGASYPLARSGLANQGLDVYRANGCAYCHSQQMRQTATVCDVIVTDVGTNRSAVLNAILRIKPGISSSDVEMLLARLPATVLKGVTRGKADLAVEDLKPSKAKTEIWIVPTGPDIQARGWGKRRSVAEDFLYDYPVMPGSQRIGPDLANIGSRPADENWHLLHLYEPRLVALGSVMPPYKFLFEKRRTDHGSSPDALKTLPPGLLPGPGFEIVPTAKAKALVAYLASLRTEEPLFEIPVTIPFTAVVPAGTNAPAGSTNAPSTNAPAK